MSDGDGRTLAVPFEPRPFTPTLDGPADARALALLQAWIAAALAKSRWNYHRDENLTALPEGQSPRRAVAFSSCIRSPAERSE